MSALVDRLAQYAAYHRDRRNIATHAVGIPMIVLAVTVLLSRPSVDIGGWAVTPAQAAVLAASIYYLRLDLRYGLVMTAVLLASLAMAQPAAAGSTSAWLWVGLGLFVVGWIIQFVGHVFEGRKPAFVDDIMGLIVGPLFVVAELGFLLGWRRDLAAVIERRAGPLSSGPAAAGPAH